MKEEEFEPLIGLNTHELHQSPGWGFVLWNPPYVCMHYCIQYAHYNTRVQYNNNVQHKGSRGTLHSGMGG